MAASIYRLTFPVVKGPQDPDGYFHRMANFGEDLDRAVRFEGVGVLASDIDSFFEEIVVEVSKRRFGAKVRGIIEKQLKAHNLFEDVVVVRE